MPARARSSRAWPFSLPRFLRGVVHVHANRAVGGRMADLHRLTWLRILVVACVALLWASAQAAIPAAAGATTYSDKSFLAGTCSGLGFPGADGFSSATAACDDLAAQAVACGTAAHASDNPKPTYSLTGHSLSGLACSYSFSWTYSTGGGGTGSGTGNLVATTQPGTCPAHSTLDAGGSTCSCSNGYQENAGHTACVPTNGTDYCSELAGSGGMDKVMMYASEAAANAVPGTGASSCSSPLGPLPSGLYVQCALTGKVSMRAAYPVPGNPNAWAVWTGQNTYTGAPCTDSTETPAGGDAPKSGDTAGACNDPAACPPPAGKCPGTVNGVSVWVPCGTVSSGSTATGSNTTTNPDGSTKKDDTTTDKSTKCVNGVCTTTTTTTTTTTNTSTTGTVTTSSTSTSGATTTGKGEYCKANPGDPQCGGEGSWGGSCSSGFTCDGDPALCAAAKGVWLQKCALVDGPASSPERTAYASAVAASGTGIPSSVVSIDSSRFDQSNSLGVAAKCISDVNVTVWDRAVSLPFSMVCPYVAQIGVINLAVSFILAAFIVFRRTA